MVSATKFSFISFSFEKTEAKEIKISIELLNQKKLLVPETGYGDYELQLVGIEKSIEQLINHVRDIIETMRGISKEH